MRGEAVSKEHLWCFAGSWSQRSRECDPASGFPTACSPQEFLLSRVPTLASQRQDPTEHRAFETASGYLIAPQRNVQKNV